MGNRSRNLELVHEVEPVRLGVLIQDAVRAAIERTVREELEAELGAAPYERAEVRHRYLERDAPTAAVWSDRAAHAYRAVKARPH